jgi:NADPH:quinone reductase-like Zn-dependent oxidoreductase
MQIEQKAHDDLIALVTSGRYRATTSRVISFAEIPDALEDLANRKTFGRVVAKP